MRMSRRRLLGGGIGIVGAGLAGCGSPETDRRGGHDGDGAGDDGEGRATGDGADLDSNSPTRWPMVGGDPGRSGYAAGVVGPTGRPSVETRFGGPRDTDYLSRPVVGRDRVALAVDDVIYVYGRDGEELWHLDIYADDQVPPALWGKTVCAVTYPNDLVGAVDGERRWTIEVDGQMSAPTVKDGLVAVTTGRAPFVGGSRRVVVASIDDGTVRWRSEQPADVLRLSWPAIAGEMLYYTVAHEPDARGSHRLVARDLETGAVAWEQPTPRFSRPIARSDRLYTIEGSGPNPYVTLEEDLDTLVARRADDGTVVWRLELSQNIGLWTPGVADETVYLPVRDRVLAIAADTGEIVWESDDFETTAGRARVGRDHVYVLVEETHGAARTLQAIDRRSGDVTWRYPFEGVLADHAALAHDALYVVDPDNPDGGCYSLA